MPTYRANADVWTSGEWVKAGGTFEADEAAVRPLLARGTVEVVAEKKSQAKPRTPRAKR